MYTKNRRRRQDIQQNKRITIEVKQLPKCLSKKPRCFVRKAHGPAQRHQQRQVNCYHTTHTTPLPHSHSIYTIRPHIQYRHIMTRMTRRPFLLLPLFLCVTQAFLLPASPLPHRRPQNPLALLHQAFLSRPSTSAALFTTASTRISTSRRAAPENDNAGGTR